MLQNIKDLYGDKIAASDGEIGHVKDFYFDDQTWVIRYLVVDTGTWLSERQVLLSPHAFGHLDRDRDIVTIKLTKKQIEDSPSIDTHRPVSRQYEEDYFRYYGWPAYWDGGGIWGLAGFSVVDTVPVKPKPLHHGHNQRDDLHLRSTKAVTGYEIQSADGPIGSVKNFLVDDKSWDIGELVVETGHWYSGKEVLISPAKIQRVSYDESKVFVTLTKSDIERTADHEVVEAGA
ncbi:MAG: PRC-barrel domain-containing protein [Opitutus sp.]